MGQGRSIMSSTGDVGGVRRSLKARIFEPTETEIADLHQDILRRNEVRRGASLPLLEVDVTLRDEVVKLRHRKFESALRPYLVEAYRETPGTPGLAGRLKQSIAAKQAAIAAMKADLGIAVSEDAGEIDLLSFILGYGQSGNLARPLIKLTIAWLGDLDVQPPEQRRTGVQEKAFQVDALIVLVDVASPQEQARFRSMQMTPERHFFLRREGPRPRPSNGSWELHAPPQVHQEIPLHLV